MSSEPVTHDEPGQQGGEKLQRTLKNRHIQLNVAIFQRSLELFTALLPGLVMRDWLAAHKYSFPPMPPTGGALRGLCART